LLVIWLLAAGSLIAAAIILLELFVARRVPALTAERLETAQQLWLRRGPLSYDIDLVIEGERAGVVHVEVRDGVAVEMTRDGKTPSQRRTWDAWSVPGLFEMLDQELTRATEPGRLDATATPGPARVRAEFDPQYGFPTQFQSVAFGGQPGAGWRVTGFTHR
jgi:hypothetical protein